ncbi:hypothetical protein VPH35_002749 [Triticum aestivum]
MPQLLCHLLLSLSPSLSLLSPSVPRLTLPVSLSFGFTGTPVPLNEHHWDAAMASPTHPAVQIRPGTAARRPLVRFQSPDPAVVRASKRDAMDLPVAPPRHGHPSPPHGSWTPAPRHRRPAPSWIRAKGTSLRPSVVSSSPPHFCSSAAPLFPFEQRRALARLR